MPPMPASASSRSTSIRRLTTRAMCPAPPAGTGRRELCDTLVRDIIPKKKLEELLGKLGHRQQDDHRALRRQQQLVRRLGVLAAEDLRPRGRAHHGRRPQEVAGRRPRSRAPTSRRSPAKTYKASGAGSVAARVPARSAAGGRRRRRPRSSTCAARRSSPARSSRRRDCPRPASAAATFPGAKSIPWGKDCNEDGTFKSFDELKALYGGAGHHRRHSR